MGVRAGDYRACLAGVEAKGVDVLPEVVQLGIGEAASAGAAQGADRRRGGSKQVDRRGDFGQRVVHAGGVATRLDDVIAGRDEGCGHVFRKGWWSMGKVRLDGGNARVLWCIYGGRRSTVDDPVGGTGGSTGRRVIAMSSSLRSGLVAHDQLV